MTVERVRSMLASGESIRLEYKAARNKVPASLYPTVCAFLNHEGGDILLGVDDAGIPVGVEPDAITEMSAAIASSTNDSTLLDPPFLLFPETIEIDGKTLILLQVPESSRVHRLKGHVYDRGADGDFRIDDPGAIARIASRKQGYYSEARVYPFLRLSDFDIHTIEKARNLMTSRRADHPWKGLSTEAMLKKAGLYARDFATGAEGYTLAAGLLLGTEETISSLVPHYKTDALLRRRDVDRYDDRIDVRISLRDTIFREVIANSLIHREFMSAGPSRFIIFGNRVEFENPCIPRLHGFLEPRTSIPFQKNPLISKFFLQLGWVEGIGSGLLTIARYLPLYAPGAWAEYSEGESFKTTIHLEPLAESPSVIDRRAHV